MHDLFMIFAEYYLWDVAEATTTSTMKSATMQRLQKVLPWIHSCRAFLHRVPPKWSKQQIPPAPAGWWMVALTPQSQPGIWWNYSAPEKTI